MMAHTITAFSSKRPNSLNQENCTTMATVGISTADRTSVLGFSSSLVATLASARSELDAFVEAQKARADEAAKVHADAVASEQDEVDRLRRRLETVQTERGLAEAAAEEEGGDGDGDDKGGIARRREMMKARQAEVEEGIEDAKQRRRELELELKGAAKEESSQKARAETALQTKAEIEEMKRVTVDDLTKGHQYYKMAGMEIVKEPHGRVRCVFTNLDEREPEREFSFTFWVNEYQEYDVGECNPELEPEVLEGILEVANARDDDDYGEMVRKIREAFKNTL